MIRCWLLLILNAPLLAEVIRKYLIRDDMVFLAADIFALLTFTGLLITNKAYLSRIPKIFFLLLSLFLPYTAILHIFSGNPLGIYGVGLRIMIMPIIYLLISAHFYKSQRNAPKLVYGYVTFWIIIICAMALTQIALGADHPINSVWGQQRLGMGDYVGEGGNVLMEGLFRPTSIFMHTGKFGQTIFALVVFRWTYLALSKSNFHPISYALIVVDFAAIFASGQRSAFVFLLACVFALMLLRSRNSRKALKGALPIVAIASLLIAMIIFMLPVYGNIFYQRFVSAIIEIPARLEGNLFLPLQSILSDFLFTGRGFGYYTFGSRMFGGKIVYFDSSLHIAGLGESSFIRICLEVGFFAAMLYIVAFFSLLAPAWKAFKQLRGSSNTLAAPAAFFVLWIGSLIIWCNTADVFSNSVSIFYGYALSGSILLRARDIKSVRHSQNNALTNNFMNTPQPALQNQVKTTHV